VNDDESSPPLRPYRGLAPFQDSELDALFFFGRDHEREIIAANLMASRLTVLYGPTGVGKSSVLRAGVAYHLRELARRNVAERGEPEFVVAVAGRWADDPAEAISAAVAEGARVVLTTGGTGLTPTDRTPEVTRALLDREVPGIAEVIRAYGVGKGVPTAALSRGLAGVAGDCLVVNLPGSRGGVRDAIAVLEPLLMHAVEQVAGSDH
jgi:molybdenum cofactor synthesis domain-containing protein